MLADPRFPSAFKPILDRFVVEYRTAVLDAGTPAAACDALLDTFLDRLLDQLERPFTFQPYHRRITAPFDYHRFGLEFLRPLVDRSRSTLAGRANLDRAAAQIAAGENVIFLANHQTEGDPQAIGLLLEDAYPDLARDMIFVAGDRVRSDPLAVPFSMGCNLLCIHSKRYIDHPPEERAAKQRHNRLTMERMRELLAIGGQCIYAAPSGGRDRPNADGVVKIAPFDPSSVEMYHLMARRAGRPSHFYPMALDTYALLPPPETVRIALGEPRRIRHSAVHLGVGAEIDMAQPSGTGAADKRASRDDRAMRIWRMVCDQYAAFPRAAPMSASDDRASSG